MPFLWAILAANEALLIERSQVDGRTKKPRPVSGTINRLILKI